MRNVLYQRLYAYRPTNTPLKVLEERMSAYLDKPENVTSVWRNFFEWNPDIFPEPFRSKMKGKLKEKTDEHNELRQDLLSEMFIYDQIQMYWAMANYHFKGHLSACIDPLNLKRPVFEPGSYKSPFRDLSLPKLIPLNKERKIILPDDSFIGDNKTILPVKDIIMRFNNSYCKHIGIEFMNNTSFELRQWVKRRFEEQNESKISANMKRMLLRRLLRAQCFEEFVDLKWPAQKHYGAAGCEMLIPALQSLIDYGSSHGAHSFVLGMTTPRARLNVLANVLRKPLQQIFVPFTGQDGGPELHEEDRYILGNNVKKVTTNQALPTEFAVLASTSNFAEAIEPLVCGKTRAEQLYTADEDGKRVWPIIIHGDEVMGGQGIVFENFRNASEENYSCKGTVHFVLTNQENLPSEPLDLYCTNVAHPITAPVFHVNSLDPEAVIFCTTVAGQYRNKFKADVVVDLICYQKHLKPNTQVPKYLRDIIEKQPALVDLYSKKLVDEGISTWDYIENFKEKYHNLLEYSYSKAQKSHFRIAEWLDSPWRRFFDSKLKLVEPNTSVIPSVYKSTLDSFINYQSDINIHPSVLNTIDKNIRLAREHKISWAMAENLAIATLLQEGFNVRLIGDYAEEGQYIDRHHKCYAVDSLKTRIPLRAIYKAQGYYTVSNSLSSECANLGFEIGFSQSSPKSLVIWESIEEDHTAAAQYIIDVFLAAGEERWFRQTGIVCLIPHGMEGKGEGFSSGRPERFLQMCNDDYSNPITIMPKQLLQCNWIVANVTTPANYFHILRRQVKVNFRKPLILFTHKSLYKNSEIFSHREDFLNKRKFQVYFPDPAFEQESEMKEEAFKVLFCTGRVYYELLKARYYSLKMKKIAICRVEQLSPFPYEIISNYIVDFKKASFHWVQEEHRNQGWWSHVRPRMNHAIKMAKAEFPDFDPSFNYIGRPTSPTTATSNYAKHERERIKFLNEAMSIV